MAKKRIFGCYCPKCKKKLFRVKVRKDKPTSCNYCDFKILNPYDVFISKSKYLRLKKKGNYKN